MFLKAKKIQKQQYMNKFIHFFENIAAIFHESWHLNGLSNPPKMKWNEKKDSHYILKGFHQSELGHNMRLTGVAEHDNIGVVTLDPHWKSEFSASQAALPSCSWNVSRKVHPYWKEPFDTVTLPTE